RIFLMKETLEGDLALDDMLPFIDRCLGCMACVTACPAGVEYGDLLAPFRAKAAEQRSRPPLDRLTRMMINQTLPYPPVARLAALTGNLVKPLAGYLPAKINAMLSLLPEDVGTFEQPAAVYPAIGQRRARVALLTGCVQQVLAPGINQATIDVLTRNGVEVVV